MIAPHTKELKNDHGLLSRVLAKMSVAVAVAVAVAVSSDYSVRVRVNSEDDRA